MRARPQGWKSTGRCGIITVGRGYGKSRLDEQRRSVGREHQLETMNRQALGIAKAVSAETGAVRRQPLQHQRLRARGRAEREGVPCDVRRAGRVVRRRRRRLRDRGDVFLWRRGQARTRHHQGRRAARSRHHGHPLRTAHPRRLDATGLLPDAGRCRRGRGGVELHPWSANDAAVDRQDRARSEGAGRSAAGAVSDPPSPADVSVAARQPLPVHSGRPAVSRRA